MWSFKRLMAFDTVKQFDRNQTIPTIKFNWIANQAKCFTGCSDGQHLPANARYYQQITLSNLCRCMPSVYAVRSVHRDSIGREFITDSKRKRERLTCWFIDRCIVLTERENRLMRVDAIWSCRFESLKASRLCNRESVTELQCICIIFFRHTPQQWKVLFHLKVTERNPR